MATFHEDLERLRRSMDAMSEIHEATLKSIFDGIRESRDEFRQAYHEFKEGLRQDFREFRAGIQQKSAIESDSQKSSSPLIHCPQLQINRDLRRETPATGSTIPVVTGTTPDPICSEKPAVNSKIEASPGLAFDSCISDTQLFDPGGTNCVNDGGGLWYKQAYWCHGMGRTLKIGKFFYGINRIKCRVAEFKQVAEFFDEMQRSGVQTDRIHFNSLLAVCSRGGSWEAARNLFDEMLNRGIEQDIFTYKTLLDAICKGGQVDSAFEILAQMPAKNIMPNVVTYSTVIDGYAKAGRFNDALTLFGEMKYLGIPLDRVSYNTLLSIFAKLGKFEEALDIVKEMASAGIRKDAVTYNALLGGYGKQGKYDEVTSVFAEVKQEHVLPNLLTYSTLLDVYSKRGLYKEAMEIFRELKSVGLRADVVLYSALIDALCKNGLVESAVSLLDEMTKEGISPNVVTYNPMIDAFGRSTTMECLAEMINTRLEFVKAFVYENGWCIDWPLAADEERSKFLKEIQLILGSFYERKILSCSIRDWMMRFPVKYLAQFDVSEHNLTTESSCGSKTVSSFFEVLMAVNKSEKFEAVAPEIIAVAIDVQERYEIFARKKRLSPKSWMFKYKLGKQLLDARSVSKRDQASQTITPFLHDDKTLQVWYRSIPVIIAPVNLLLTRAEDFKKWNISTPFHNLSSLELNEKESSAVVNLLMQKNSSARSNNEIRMVKIYSWIKSKSILGISYNLNEKLAGVRDKDKKSKTVKPDKELDDIREILMGMPGLLVLAEAHTLRNQRSCIWETNLWQCLRKKTFYRSRRFKFKHRVIPGNLQYGFKGKMKQKSSTEPLYLFLIGKVTAKVVNHTPFSVDTLGRLKDQDALLIKQFLLSHERFQIKHKWRFKLLPSFFELESYGNALCSSLAMLNSFVELFATMRSQLLSTISHGVYNGSSWYINLFLLYKTLRTRFSQTGRFDAVFYRCTVHTQLKE